MTKYTLCPLITLLFILSSCREEPVGPDPVDHNTSTSKGIYILNEGLIHMNNSTLTWYSFSDSIAQSDYFNLKNGRKLGDTGSDMGIYGSKMYIVMSISGQVEVVELNTGKSIKQIPLFNGEKSRQPRSITFHGSKAFVCSFDGTLAVIDTATLTVEKYIPVGRNPDGIAAANNKIYVSNSGGLDFPDYDNTVSVIDTESLMEIKKIQVNPNPYTIVPDKNDYLYVISRGNYTDIKTCLQVIDSKTDENIFTFPDIEVISLAIHNDTAFVCFFDYMNASGSKVKLLDLKSRTVIRENFITDGTIVDIIYAISIDENTGDVFIADAQGFVNTGTIICFNREGKKKYSFRAGLNPVKMQILY